ncbi:hypothetical protein FGO68_gene9023 [Halteria grandinella]|uniref:Secreted protein n=1 Tax=Halteria grandinella TaxID=5974 RepID=A0A8J8P3C4_HALGN|nr:hypothetical protein FGO68_gene9023 [Halteria grandinella]
MKLCLLLMIIMVFTDPHLCPPPTHQQALVVVSKWTHWDPKSTYLGSLYQSLCLIEYDVFILQQRSPVIQQQ